MSERNRNLSIAHRRLRNQRIAGAGFASAGEVVAWMGAVQAQDYLGALWALGLRMETAREEAIEQAIADRTVVRSWPLRGTLHFVAPTDLRWMLALLAPRVIAGQRGRHRQLGLDQADFDRSRDLLTCALEGGRQLTRDALYEILEAAGISTAGQRGIHILWRVALDGVLCFAARQGKQQTFALLEEWVPAARMLECDEALAELAARYFTSHGPATVQDFTWWSGLTVADAKTGIELAGPRLERRSSTAKRTGSPRQRRPRGRKRLRSICCRPTTSTPSPTRTAAPCSTHPRREWSPATASSIRRSSSTARWSAPGSAFSRREPWRSPCLPLPL